MTTDTFQLLILSLVWLAYFVLHSITASLSMKRWVAGHWPKLMPAYRLLFNGLAGLLIVIPLGLGLIWRGEALWVWSGVGWWLINGIALVTLIVFYWSLSFYDTGEFLGTKQWRERNASVEDQEAFHISPLHRFVRHPWYTLGLILIWTRDMDPAFLISAIWLTLYFVIGSRLEERKLIVYHGERYRYYRQRVPGLIPLPWRYLSKNDAVAMEKPAWSPERSVSS
ncbi:MAG: hypothetical protein GY934_04310 [Gammaproteobacteria bacterium]|nr:hypothetical protein [Gammaproteobacteria bacterium]